jgi:hypothetical protein
MKNKNHLPKSSQNVHLLKESGNDWGRLDSHKVYLSRIPLTDLERILGKSSN